MTASQQYIAVFDSGVGGISVLRQLRKALPGEKFLYYGDSANAPYGSRSTEQVRQLSLNVAEKLLPMGIKALVVACNTATAAAIETLRQTYPELIIVGIEPALKPAADRFPGGCIGVLATEVTLREEKFRQLAAHFSGDCQVVKFPAPGLMELVEQGKGNSKEAEKLLQSIFGPWVGKLDALVLGCTHYPFATGAIGRVLGENVALFDGGEGTARETKRRLAQKGLLREDMAGEIIWCNSLPSPEIIALSQKLLESESL